MYFYRLLQFCFCFFFTWSNFVDSNRRMKPMPWRERSNIWRFRHGFEFKIFTNIYEYFVINRNCRCLFTNIFYFLKIHICRKMLGEGLDASSIEELQQLENQLDRSLMKIRAKKVTYIYIYDVIIIYLLFHRDLRLWRGGLVRFLFIKRILLSQMSWLCKQ